MGAREKVSDGMADVRRRAPWLDHLIRGWRRYQEDHGDRLAAYVTYFGFLSFFPLVALAFSIAGFVVDAYPSAQQDLVRQINNFLPGLSDKLNVATIGHAKVATGIIGLLGLLLAGLGWIDALREAIRTVWHHDLKAGNFLTKKLKDTVILAGLGLTMVASVAVTGVSSSATGWFLRQIGLDGSAAADILLRVLGYVLALGVDLALFLFILTRLPKVATPMRRVLKGALFGAIGFEILKTAGSFLVKTATHNPVYGVFAVVVGLLIWINYLSRFTLYVAAWTVTAPFDTDVRPSGTSDPEIAEAAGVSPDSATDREPEGIPVAVAVPVNGNGHAHFPAQTQSARAAGFFGLGVMAAGTAGVAWSGLRAARDAVRRD